MVQVSASFFASVPLSIVVSTEIIKISLMTKLWLIFLNPPPIWFQSRTDDSPLFSPAFSQYFEYIKSMIQFHSEPMYYLFYVWKGVENCPTTQTDITALYILYVMRIYFLTQQARDWISNGSLFVWSGLVTRYWVLRLIGVNNNIK